MNLSYLIQHEPEKAFKIISSQNQNNIDVQRMKAICLMRLDKHNDAIPILKNLIRKEEKREDYIAISAAYTRNQDHANAINVLKKVIQKKPQDTAIVLHLADKLFLLKRFDEIFDLLNNYKTYEVYNKIADFSVKLRLIDEAEIAAKKSLSIKENPEVHLTLAEIYNLKGLWKDAFREQEWRFENFKEYETYFLRYPKSKMWDGKQSLKNKTVIVYAEQGFGDTIQYYRFMKNIPDAKVIFNCQSPLVSLLDEYETFSCNAAEEQPKIAYDYHIPSVSLPYLLDIDKIDTSPYLKAKNPVKLDGTFKVGISWAGSNHYKADRTRSMPQKFFNIPNAQLYNLQVPRQETLFTSISFDIRDFSDTANIISSLDLVVCCDTSVAHLAGALGVKTLIATHFCADSRWGVKWYDSAQIIGQTEIDNWETVFAEINSICANLSCGLKPS